MNHTMATNATSEATRAGASATSIARSTARWTGMLTAALAVAMRSGRGASSSPTMQAPAKTALPTAIAAPPMGSVEISASMPRAGNASASARLRASPADAGRRWPVEALTVEGNRNYTREQVLAVAGLKVGQLAGKPEFEAGLYAGGQLLPGRRWLPLRRSPRIWVRESS